MPSNPVNTPGRLYGQRKSLMGRTYGAWGTYIRDFNWVTCLVGVYSGRGDGILYAGGVLTGFYGS